MLRNADSISRRLRVAEQMVCMIGPHQLQGHWNTHKREKEKKRKKKGGKAEKKSQLCIEILRLCISANAAITVGLPALNSFSK